MKHFQGCPKDLEDCRRELIFKGGGALTISLMVTCAFVNLSSAVAQAQSESRDDNQLAEIVVTAQKRSENIQDAPLSVTAFSGSTLAAAGIRVVSDLGEIDSTLQFSAIGGIATVFMRGLGNPVATSGNEASVPMYIDDVYYSRLSPSFFDLANVKDVEILKGRGFGSTTIYPYPGGPLSGLGPSFLSAPPFDQTQDFEKLTYKVSVDHHFDLNVMAYALVSTGYKSGTFNTVSISSGALEPETVTTYEFGLKTELLDHRLRLDGAVFRNNLKDPQVQSTQMGFETVINAGSARSQGVEVESTALLARGLTARLSATYLQAEFLDFGDAPYFYQRPGGGNSLGSINASGNALPRAPRESIDAGLNYIVDVASVGKFAIDTNVAYSSKFYWDSDNVISQGTLTIVNASDFHSTARRSPQYPTLGQESHEQGILQRRVRGTGDRWIRRVPRRSAYRWRGVPVQVLGLLARSRTSDYDLKNNSDVEKKRPLPRFAKCL